MSKRFDVLILGGEPASFACARELVLQGTRVAHVFPSPFGLSGASRDIGLAYPELGEPWERLRDAVGEEIGLEFHRWSRAGVEELTQLASDQPFFRRGSRLAVARTDTEVKLMGQDALERQKIGDELRLMSGAAASNYAPLSDLIQASFETHTIAFPPVPLMEFLHQKLMEHEAYTSVPLPAGEEWARCRLEEGSEGPELHWDDQTLSAEVVVVAAATESRRILGRFNSVLVALPGQAFRSPPLREVSRSSVVGISGAWGYERFRFDAEQRLLGCGINPAGGLAPAEPEVEPEVQEVFLRRSRALFMELFAEAEECLRWGVHFTVTCDGLPLLGPLPGKPRVQVVEGFGVSAWSRGYQAGRVIGQALTRERFRNPLLERCSVRRLI